MCGLIGVAADYVIDKHKNIFNQMLWCSTLRGFDATGVFAVQKEFTKKDVFLHHYKKALFAPIFIGQPGYQELIKERDIKVLAGHNRAKTFGDNSDDNAHPFTFSNVIGMHNGTLTHCPGFNKYPTDSESLYRSINDLGIDETISETRGAYALVFFNRQDHTLNFLRNKERTLYITSDLSNNELYWASEFGMLTWLLGRNNISHQKIVSLKENLLISFPITENMFTSKITAREVKQKEAFKGDNSSSFFPGSKEGWPWEKGTKEEKKNTLAPCLVASTQNPVGVSNVTRISARGSSVRPIMKIGKSSNHDTYKGYRGATIPRHEYLETLSDGCLICSKISLPNRPHRWVNLDHYLCEECKSNQIFQYEESSVKSLH